MHLTPRFPDFLVVGTQKGGTTTLHDLLLQHPQVYLPPCKEVHYFSLNYQHGAEWYSDHFKDATHDQICGDITPYYCFHPLAPSRIKKLVPRVKIIFLLRDPVDRALSHYFHAVRHGFETLPLQTALSAECERLANCDSTFFSSGRNHFSHQKHSYLARGHYALQLRRYLQFFRPDQILVLRSEDLFAHPLQVTLRLQKFLGIPNMELPDVATANSGRGEARAVDNQLKTSLRQLFDDDVSFVRRNYGFDWGW